VTGDEDEDMEGVGGASDVPWRGRCDWSDGGSSSRRHQGGVVQEIMSANEWFTSHTQHAMLASPMLNRMFHGVCQQCLRKSSILLRSLSGLAFTFFQSRG
jgi:hypothetical protein